MEKLEIWPPDLMEGSGLRNGQNQASLIGFMLAAFDPLSERVAVVLELQAHPIWPTFFPIVHTFTLEVISNKFITIQLVHFLR